MPPARFCVAELESSFAGSLRGKKVLVVGLARSGLAVAKLCRTLKAEVTLADLKTAVEPAVLEELHGIKLELGPHQRSTFLNSDLIVVSPGIPAAQPDIKAARDAGVPVIGELGFAASFLEHLPTAAITGTNGKSTVTWFCGQLLSHAGWRPFVGGNLGNPLTSAVLDELKNQDEGPDAEDYDSLVVEVSSYQMELPGKFRPDIAVVLNLTPDHLGRHGTMDSYGECKCRVFSQMTPANVAVLPPFDPLLTTLAQGHGTPQRACLGPFHPASDSDSDLAPLFPAGYAFGVVRAGRRALVRLPTLKDEGVTLDLTRLSPEVVGDHNLDNAATAALLAIGLGADPVKVEAGFAVLKPLPHRMQTVAVDTSSGVAWINDSKATNVEAAIVGLKGIGTRPAVVLLGGRAKEGPASQFDPLVPLLAGQRAVLTFGEAGDFIADRLLEQGLACPLRRVKTMREAVPLAKGLAQPGDVVLLSPACASFDEFDDFEHRGRVFEELSLEQVSC